MEIPQDILEIIDLDREGLTKLLASPESDVHWDRDYLLDNIKIVDSDESGQEEIERTDEIVNNK